MLPPPAAGAPQLAPFPQRPPLGAPPPPRKTEFFTRKYSLNKVVPEEFQARLKAVVPLANAIIRDTSEVVNLLIFERLDAFRAGRFGGGFEARKRFELAVAPLYKQNSIKIIASQLSKAAPLV